MNATLKIPSLPNFITAVIAGKEVQLSIVDVPEDELRQLGERWTAQLIATAKDKRKAEDLANLATRCAR